MHSEPIPHLDSTDPKVNPPRPLSKEMARHLMTYFFEVKKKDSFNDEAGSFHASFGNEAVDHSPRMKIDLYHEGARNTQDNFGQADPDRIAPVFAEVYFLTDYTGADREEDIYNGDTRDRTELFELDGAGQLWHKESCYSGDGKFRPVGKVSVLGDSAAQELIERMQEFIDENNK